MSALNPVHVVEAVMLNVASEHDFIPIIRQAQAGFAALQGGGVTFYQALLQQHGRINSRHGTPSQSREADARTRVLRVYVCFIAKLKYMTGRAE